MKKLGSYALIIILIAVAMVGFEDGKHTEAAVNHPVDDASVQLAQLMNIGKVVIQDKVRVTIKWQGEWNTLLAPEEAADVLSTRLGLSGLVYDKVQDHTQYYALGDLNGVQSKLSVTVREKGRLYVVLRLETETLEGMNALGTLQYNYGSSLADEGVNVKWNAALQGMTNEQTGDMGGVQSLTPGEKLKNVEQQVENTIQPLKMVESYEDGNTISRSYEMAGLPISVYSGDHQISLQVALHRNLDAGRQEISIGSPLLTIEY